VQISQFASQRWEIIEHPELGYPEKDHNKSGPRPKTFSVMPCKISSACIALIYDSKMINDCVWQGQRALNFVLRNQELIDKTLLFDNELLKIIPSQLQTVSSAGCTYSTILLFRVVEIEAYDFLVWSVESLFCSRRGRRIGVQTIQFKITPRFVPLGELVQEAIECSFVNLCNILLCFYTKIWKEVLNLTLFLEKVLFFLVFISAASLQKYIRWKIELYLGLSAVNKD
jgi:hypothetical protein